VNFVVVVAKGCIRCRCVSCSVIICTCSQRCVRSAIPGMHQGPTPTVLLCAALPLPCEANGLLFQRGGAEEALYVQDQPPTSLTVQTCRLHEGQGTAAASTFAAMLTCIFTHLTVTSLAKIRQACAPGTQAAHAALWELPTADKHSPQTNAAAEQLLVCSTVQWPIAEPARVLRGLRLAAGLENAWPQMTQVPHKKQSVCPVMQEDKVAVLVGTVTDDVRLFEVPALKVCALKFTETARARIVKVRPHALSSLLESHWHACSVAMRCFYSPEGYVTQGSSKATMRGRCWWNGFRTPSAPHQQEYRGGAHRPRQQKPRKWWGGES
jgi:Ribosomal protein 60S L18 and 50S L18e